MKQDIRALLKDFELSKKELPAAHRTEFLDKLQASNKPKGKANNFNIVFRIAASVALFVAIGYLALNSLNPTDPVIVESTIELQLKGIESQYLEHIDIEWQNFIALATDEKLVKRYEEKLSELDADYQEISKVFRQNKNNIIFIEALVENLKTRLQLLRDIQEHINLLNQKSEQHETIIL